MECQYTCTEIIEWKNKKKSSQLKFDFNIYYKITKVLCPLFAHIYIAGLGNKRTGACSDSVKNSQWGWGEGGD